MTAPKYSKDVDRMVMPRINKDEDKADIDKFCKGIFSGKGRVNSCLKSHGIELSDLNRNFFIYFFDQYEVNKTQIRAFHELKIEFRECIFCEINNNGIDYWEAQRTYRRKNRRSFSSIKNLDCN